MKLFKLLYVGIISLGYYVPQSLSVEAAISTRVIDTDNLNDSQVRNYYNGYVTEGMTGANLKTALNNRIKNHTPITSYPDTKNAMAIVERDYSLSPLADGTTYNFANASGDNPYLRLMYGKYNGDPLNAVRWNESHTEIWNKEHTWAKSLGNFGETYPAGTDLHHLIGADQRNNNYHSNLDFGDVVSGAFDVLDERGNVSGKTGYSTLSNSRKVYEPADEYKGDIARMVFYMATRYIEYSSTGNPKLRIIEGLAGNVTVISSATVFGELGILSHYLRWNEEDPVDSYEIKRNNLIYNNFQYNRNPYIDHPEWAEMVFDTSYSGAGATNALESSSVGSLPAWSNTAARTLQSISTDASSVLTNFAQNEPFTSTGLIVTATLSDSSTKVVNGWTTNFDGLNSFATTGNQQVTVSYSEGGITKTSSYEINVFSKTLTSISVDSSNAQTTFPYKGNFSSENLIVTANYSDTTTRILNSTQYHLSTADLTKIGSQNLTISYASMSNAYSIQVTFNQAAFSIPTQLFFSQYLEGSGNNKLIEIYNGTFQTLSLSGYSVKLFANGTSTATTTYTMSGSLPHGQTFVIFNNGVADGVATAINAINSSYKASSGVASFNGDDAIGLYFNNFLIDRIGNIGSDPGTAWQGSDVDDNELSTFDKTLVRTSNVFQGNTSFNWSGEFSEWRVFPLDDASNIGLHTIEGDDLVDSSVAYADYFLSVTSPYCESLNGVNIPWNILATEYGYLTNVMKDYFTTTNQATILSARLRYEFLVNKYPTLDANNFLVNGSNTPLYAFKIEDKPNRDDSEILMSLIFSSMITLILLQIFDKKRKFQ